MILPQLLVMPSNLEGRILLQPLSTSTFNVQIPEISAETEISFKVQASDSSVASAGGHSLGTRVVDFAFDVNWVGAGTCVVTITAVCNCSANASSALLYVRSLPLLVATPSFVDVINPQGNVTINISLQQPITSTIVINLQPNVPLAFLSLIHI